MSSGGGDANSTNNNNSSDGVVRSRIDASSARLTSLRTDGAAAPSRRPKFVPKAAKRRTGTESHGDGENPPPAPAAASQQQQPSPREARDGKAPRGSDFVRDRPRAGRGDAGRGRGGRGGRGVRGNLPTGKVTFVGTLSGGSSYSSVSPAAPRAVAPKPTAAADGVGISVLDDEDGNQLRDGFHAMQVEEQWPPAVPSVMGPMSLPVARPPEPKHTGTVFYDPEGQSMLAEDSLVFIQFPTTLPLANAVATLPKGKEDVEMPDAEESPALQSVEEARRSKLAVKEETATQAQQQESKSDDSADEASAKTASDELFDRSIATAPGGFIGKLCIRKSGKTVLMIGDKQFDVAMAQTPSFCEEVYSIDTSEKQLCMLGSVERHLVVTPDFDALLS